MHSVNCKAQCNAQCKVHFTLAGMAKWIAHPLHMKEVHGLFPRWARVVSEDPFVQVTLSSGDGASTLALKPMGGV